jgi:hypothetical protein
MSKAAVISAMHQNNTNANEVEMNPLRGSSGKRHTVTGADEALCDLLESDGFPATTVSKVRESELTFDELGALDSFHWAHIGVNLAAEIRLRTWYTEKTKLNVDDYPDFPASLPKNLQSHLFALLLMAPVFAIGMLSDIDDGNLEIEGHIETPGIHDFEVQTERVTIPGICILLFLYLITMIIRTQLGKDMIEEKSEEVDVGASQSSVLANSGLVCALFLTIVIAMAQADAPVQGPDGGVEGRMICQYYMLFNVMALFLCFLGCMMSSMLLNYISPLDDKASHIYFTNFIDYFGEPACCILVAILMFIYAIICWTFGRYGKAVGIVLTLAMDLCMQRIILTQMYLSMWNNPFIEDHVRKNNMITKN